MGFSSVLKATNPITFPRFKRLAVRLSKLNRPSNGSRATHGEAKGFPRPAKDAIENERFWKPGPAMELPFSNFRCGFLSFIVFCCFSIY